MIEGPWSSINEKLGLGLISARARTSPQVLAGYLDEIAVAVGTAGGTADDDDATAKGAVDVFANVCTLCTWDPRDLKTSLCISSKGGARCRRCFCCTCTPDGVRRDLLAHLTFAAEQPFLPCASKKKKRLRTR